MKASPEICSRHARHLALFTLITFALPQCASTEDGRLAQGQGAAIGAVGGALLGAGIGALTGDSQTALKGAAIGAAAGGAAGFGYGTHIANRKAQYKSTEEWLDACIVQAETRRKQAVAYNSRLNNQLARLENEVKIAKAAGDKKKLASLNREIKSESAGAKKEVAIYSKEAQDQRGAIQQAGGQGGSRLKTLRTSTTGIDTQVSTMNSNVQRFAALESQTDV
jgi:hypothetical protein